MHSPASFVTGSMINICYIISDIAKSYALEWNIEYLDYSKFRLHVILMNNGDTEFEEFLRKKNIPVYRLPRNSKVDIVKDIFKINKYLRKEKIQIVHCHLFEASYCGFDSCKAGRN